MSSGMYAALSGAVAKMHSLDITANNLGNAETPGYKKDRYDFEALFRDVVQNYSGGGVNFVRLQRNYTDFSQAELTKTGNPLDVAIEGPGFFKLRGPDGDVYSRVGKFGVDDRNRLVGSEGLPVIGAGGGPITIADPASVEIDQSGRIRDANGAVGELPLFATSDPAGMKKLGRGLFAPAAGSQEQRVAGSRLLQKHLENSNVRPLQEMTDMIDGLRAFEAYQKVLKTYSNLAGKARELGSVG